MLTLYKKISQMKFTGQFSNKKTSRITSFIAISCISHSSFTYQYIYTRVTFTRVPPAVPPSLPDRLLEENGEESDANTTAGLSNNLHELSPASEVLAQHQVGGLPRHPHANTKHQTVAAGRGNRERPADRWTQIGRGGKQGK